MFNLSQQHLIWNKLWRTNDVTIKLMTHKWWVIDFYGLIKVDVIIGDDLCANNDSGTCHMTTLTPSQCHVMWQFVIFDTAHISKQFDLWIEFEKVLKNSEKPRLSISIEYQKEGIPSLYITSRSMACRASDMPSAWKSERVSCWASLDHKNIMSKKMTRW